MKSKMITIGICVFMLLFGWIITRVMAAPSQEELDKARIVQLQTEVASMKESYAKLEPIKARNQQFCTLAAQQEKQLTQYSIMANAKRSELSFLKSKYPDLFLVGKK